MNFIQFTCYVTNMDGKSLCGFWDLNEGECMCTHSGVCVLQSVAVSKFYTTLEVYLHKSCFDVKV